MQRIKMHQTLNYIKKTKVPNQQILRLKPLKLPKLKIEKNTLSSWVKNCDEWKKIFYLLHSQGLNSDLSRIISPCHTTQYRRQGEVLVQPISYFNSKCAVSRSILCIVQSIFIEILILKSVENAIVFLVCRFNVNLIFLIFPGACSI